MKNINTNDCKYKYMIVIGRNLTLLELHLVQFWFYPSGLWGKGHRKRSKIFSSKMLCSFLIITYSKKYILRSKTQKIGKAFFLYLIICLGGAAVAGWVSAHDSEHEFRGTGVRSPPPANCFCT